MKLERALAFFHSKKMGVEPGSKSKSFDLNEGDQNSAAYKLQNKKVKHVSTILRKNERGLDQSDCIAAPKPEFYNSGIDFNGDHVANVVDFVAPNSNSSEDKRGLDPSQNELQSAGRKAMPKLEFYDSMLDLKSQYEPEMEVYYQGNTYQCHLVKEVCVNGVLMKPSLIFEDSAGDNAYNCIPSLVYGSKEIPKNNAGNKGFTLQTTNGSENVSADHDWRNDVNHKEDVRENHIGNTHEETELPEDTDDSIPPGDKDEQFSSEPEYVSKFLKPKKFLEEGVSEGPTLGLAIEESEPEYVSKFLKPKKVLEEGVSAGPALGLAVEESEPEYVSKFLKPEKVSEEGVSAGPALGLAVEESNSDGTRSLSYHFEPSALADCGKKDCHHLGVCNCDVTHHTSKPLEGHFVHGESSQIRNSLGEASFSALGPVSGRISYSGSIPYSGSISIRSESSTASTRSFAFPILQSEYVTSPVRMGKPEKECCFRKQSSWKNLLLCCKF